MQTKTRIVNAMIFPVIPYGCETWTKTREMEKKIDACEMWIWRKMLRDEKRTNESILNGDQTSKRSFVAEKEGSKTEDDVLWPVMRANGMEKDIMLTCGEGRRKRLKKKWMEEMHTMSGMNLVELRNAVEDWEMWRKLTMSIARTLQVEGTR